MLPTPAETTQKIIIFRRDLRNSEAQLSKGGDLHPLKTLRPPEKLFELQMKWLR